MGHWNSSFLPVDGCRLMLLTIIKICDTINTNAEEAKRISNRQSSLSESLEVPFRTKKKNN